jgi:SAM-dependent methyltransferase
VNGHFQTIADRNGIRFDVGICSPPSEREDPHQIVKRGYDAMADRYLAWTSSSAVRTLWLDRLLHRLGSGSRVLDLGCGAGVPVAQRLTEAGHHVLGIDNSPAQIKLARHHVPSAEFIVHDVASLKLGESSIDAVVAFYSITHVQRDLHATLFRNIAEWLVPGGTFLASLGTSDCPGWTGAWLGADMYFSHFDAAENLRLLRSVGFHIRDQQVIGEEEHGTTADFLWVTAEKPIRISGGRAADTVKVCFPPIADVRYLSANSGARRDRERRQRNLLNTARLEPFGSAVAKKLRTVGSKQVSTPSSPSKMCPPNCRTRWRLFDSLFEVASAQSGGVTGSSRPEISRTAAAELTGCR